MKKYICSLALGMMALLSSCALENDFHDSLKSPVNITLLENLGGDRPILQLLFETSSVYNCTNYLIEMDATENDRFVEFVLREVYGSPACNLGNGPAYSEYTFVNKAANTSYNISMRINDRTPVAGTLTIGDTYYTIAVAGKEDFKLINTRVYKMPKGMVWGSTQKLVESDMADKAIDKFSEMLHNQGLADTTLVQGDYTYFLIGDENKVTLRQKDNVQAGTAAFVYYMNADSVNTNELSKAISNFRGSHAELVAIRVFDWRGIVY